MNAEMYRIFAFLLCLICAPAMAFTDACTNPNEYTIDHRCYVTDAQKQQKPFSAAVAMVWPNGIPYCTGTIIKGYGNDQNGIYVYTAKHCTDKDHDGNSDANLIIRLQNGNQYDVEYVDAGAYDIIKNENSSGDYAIYKINNAPDDIPYTTIANNKLTYSTDQIAMHTRVLGHGSLKVMSDKEIQDFRNKYRDFLKAKGYFITYAIFDFVYDDGLSVLTDLVQSFIKELGSNNDTFNDKNRLKVSDCSYSGTGIKINCQAWSGDSGGGLFNNNGNLIGINTESRLIIGGTQHAGYTPKSELLQSPQTLPASVPIRTFIKHLDAANDDLAEFKKIMNTKPPERNPDE